jgi:hypothetical protein
MPLTDMVIETPLGHRVRISTREIPVSYKDVREIVPTLHHDFDFIIHAGVGRNGFITLEKRADSGGYFGKDIHGRHGPLESHGIYVTRWNVEKLLALILQSGYKVTTTSALDWRLICRKRKSSFRMMRDIISASIFTFGVWKSLL